MVLRLLLALLALPAILVGGQASPRPPWGVEGTMLRVVTPGGRILTSPDLVGAVLDTVDEDGRAITVRIDTVAQDPTDLSGDIWLHGFSVLDHEAGLWREFCQSAPDGTRAGFPLAGRWTTDMRHLPASSGFTLTCTSGASGKCVRMDYKSWRKVGTDSLWEYHQACVRVIRADYGGDGISHTCDGTRIDLFDRLGVQRRDHVADSLTFEAAWSADGAICVRRTRVPGIVLDDDLTRQYARLAGRVGSICSEETPAPIWNRS
jgi:hypothetical protein